MKRLILPALLLTMVGCMSPSQNAPDVRFSSLPTLPDSIGVAGPFAGTTNNALIVAGGANFPGGRPWDDSKPPKVYHDRIYVMTSPEKGWEIAKVRLPHYMGYGASISTPGGVLCIGGMGATRYYPDTCLIQWERDYTRVVPLGPFPFDLAECAAAAVGDHVYVLGGRQSPSALQANSSAWCMRLGGMRSHWRRIADPPFSPRLLPMAVEVDGSLLIAGGIALDNAGQRIKPFLTDAWLYTPAERTGDGTWRRVADLPYPLAAASAAGVGSRAFVFSGDDGSSRGALERDAHPGFRTDILMYDAKANRWSIVGQLPKPQDDQSQWPAVTTTAVPWQGRIIIPSGEIRPGVRTPGVRAVEFEDKK